MTITASITRGSQWETSYDVWTKLGSVPLEEGDGIFVGNYTISPNQTSVTISLPSYVTGYSYGFMAVPITNRDKGPTGIFSP